MMKEKNKFQRLTSENICLAYELLHKNKLISFALTQDAQHKIEALVENINGTSYSVEHYKTPQEKAVAYLYFLVKNHPFTDGNKRTASFSFEIICDLNYLEPNYQDFTLDELVVFVEKIRENDHQLVIKTIADIMFNEK